MFSKSEQKVISQIKKEMTGISQGIPYMFWFIYDDDGNAISWEGGYEMYGDPKFRNQYTVEKNKPIVKNW